MIGKVMKRLLKAAFAVTAVCLLASCDQDGNIQTTLGLTPRALSLPAEGGSSKISFSAAAEWTIAIDKDWVSVSQKTGPAGDYSLNLTVDANPSPDPRTTSVTVSCMNLSESVVITQDGQPVIPDPVLTLSSSSAEIGSNGGTVNLTVSANNEWTASSDGDWLKVTPDKGTSGSATVTLEARANTSTQAREGKVKFSSANLEQEFTVIQAGIPAPFINLSSGSFVYSAGGGSYNLTVYANRDWTSSSDASWVTLNPDSGVSGSSDIVVSVSENTDYEERTATVTFSADNETVSLVIIQRAADTPEESYVTLSSPSVNFPSDGGVTTLIVTSNEQWSASVRQADWIAVTPQSGIKGATSIAITAEENKLSEDRSAVIVFTAGNFQTELTVSQKGVPEHHDDPVLILSVSELNFTAEAGENSFLITTNQDWTIDSQNSPWIRTSVTSGAPGTLVSVVVTVEANTSESQRNGSIIVSAGNLRQSVLVVQAGVQKEPDPVIDLSSTAVNFTEEGGTMVVVVMADHDWKADGTAS